ncbi:hypothetical protein [Rhodoblastus sp.]|jgi:hypothetical protein|uniref:hypothetical protein n=1 Tax=Rhodoblastus sp. TaxID=1962975 RepID=UPI002627D533|nr:hypothetical protein [Rhodoblastus sp.]
MQETSRIPEGEGEPENAPQSAPPALSPAKLAEKQRLAEALRANLRRRKDQSRQRKAKGDDDAGSGNP